MTEYLIEKYLQLLKRNFRDHYKSWMKMVKRIIEIEDQKTQLESRMDMN